MSLHSDLKILFTSPNVSGERHYSSVEEEREILFHDGGGVPELGFKAHDLFKVQRYIQRVYTYTVSLFSLHCQLTIYCHWLGEKKAKEKRIRRWGKGE